MSKIIPSKEKKELCKELPMGRTLALLSKFYFGALTKKLEHLEIERYYSILIVIENSSDGITQQNISDVLKIDKASMVRIIDFLVKKKFIKRILNPNDRREYLIVLTTKAETILPEIHVAIDEVDEAATKGLTKLERTAFYAALQILSTNLDNLPAHKMILNLKKAKQG